VKRLAYIDWMRGLACVLMFQDHCYDSWLTTEWHKTEFVRWSEILGTVPAPLFLFIAGVSVSLTTMRFREKGMARNQIAKHTILRGAEVFGLGLLFRIQEYALGHKWVPWTDLLRVDILNILGLSIAFMGVLCWFGSAKNVEAARRRSLYLGLAMGTMVAVLTPPLWSTWRPRVLPWPLESYLNGVHTLNVPQHWLFPIFPWSAFAFIGLATGFVLLWPAARKNESRLFGWIAGTGAIAIVLSVTLDALPIRIYFLQDYWHASPSFFMLRCGVLLLLLAIGYAWCQKGPGQQGFSPVVQLGKTSLLVYWVHLEFVYGRFSILRKHECGVGKATIGLIVIFLGMWSLSLWRTEAKETTIRVLPQQPQPVSLAPAT
jgi:uncharacterized membrane protein